MEQIVPYQLRIVSPIRENDERFMYIQELIEAKRNMLVNKQKKFRFITKQNRFLDVVKHDYEKFYGYISKQKREQIKALEVLDEYIKDLTISGKLTKHNIEDAKEEQLKILRELNFIKESLDTIIDNTQDIVSKKKYYSL
jgi:cell division septum initiation protein DivIVA